MDEKSFEKAIKILKGEYKNWNAPATILSQNYDYERTPYTILISTLLSFRTKDEQTVAASSRLFRVASTPKEMVKLSSEEIAKIIYPVGFYRKKAKSILEVSKILIDRFDSKVPDSLDQLTSIKGVGPKTAKIVLEKGFDKDVMAVDTHVHRILNLWGFIHTSSPEESDKILEKKIRKNRKGLNKILVSFGQSICRPVSPKCDACPVANMVKCGSKSY